ncbi:hypothetical protein GcC1_166005 [Golovinomyces cichoracearum]|uniref:Uncharacterized protein n=1 Tax=Golovinomyces cichoracearum TaxID=62708 RepID=A0A420HSG7_9PEZI|nr:hypothetical protein GcC1_166005 [Golovinomyces cichoracearum]
MYFKRILGSEMNQVLFVFRYPIHNNTTKVIGITVRGMIVCTKNRFTYQKVLQRFFEAVVKATGKQIQQRHIQGRERIAAE